MFIFDTGFAKLFYAFEVVFRYLINGSRFIIRVLVFRLRIRKVGFIEAFYLSEVDSIYQLRGLDYFCIAGMFKAAMPKLDLWVSAETVDRLTSSSHKYCPFCRDGFEYKKIFILVCHPQCTPSLLEYHGVGVIVV